jgi:hypothetical protein
VNHLQGWRHVIAIWAIIIPVVLGSIAGLHLRALLRAMPQNTAWDGVVIPRHDSAAIHHHGMEDVER